MDVTTGGHVLVGALLIAVATRVSSRFAGIRPVALLGSPSLLAVLEATARLLSVHTAAGGVGGSSLSSAFGLLAVLIVPL